MLCQFCPSRTNLKNRFVGELEKEAFLVGVFEGRQSRFPMRGLHYRLYSRTIISRNFKFMKGDGSVIVYFRSEWLSPACCSGQVLG